MKKKSLYDACKKHIKYKDAGWLKVRESKRIIIQILV